MNWIKKTRGDLFSIVFLVGLGAFFVWNIFPTFSTRIIGDGGDAPIFAWNLWWVKYSLINLHQNPYFTDFIFNPQGVSLQFHTLALINGFLSAPFQLFLSLTTVHNLIFFINLLLGLICTYFLAKKLGLSCYGAIVSSMIFSFSPAIFAHALGHFNLTTAWFIPLALIFTIKTFGKGDKYSFLVVSLVTALAVYNDFYIGIYTVLTILLYGIYLYASKKQKLRELVLGYIKIAVASLVMLSPLILMIVKLEGSSVVSRPNFDEYIFGGADILSLVTPSFQNNLSSFIGFGTKIHLSKNLEGVTFIGYTSMALLVGSWVILFFKKFKSLKKLIFFITLSASFFVILSLGPVWHFANKEVYLNIFGNHYKIGFFALAFTKMPILSSMRIFSRFIIPAMMFIGLGAGIFVSEIEGLFLSKKSLHFKAVFFAIFIAITTLVYLEFNVKPIKTESSTIPQIYEIVKNDPRDKVLLEIPFRLETGRTWRIGGGFSMQQFYQSYHLKKTISGQVSFASQESVRQITDDKNFLNFALGCNEQVDRDELVKSLIKFNIGYIVITKQDSPSGQWHNWSDDYFKNITACVLNKTGGSLANQSGDRALVKI